MAVGEQRRAGVGARDGLVDVAGRELRLTSLDRVLYPQTGTTKGDVVSYLEQIAPVMLPHLAGRPVTRRRWPGGVGEAEFYAKDLEPGTPAWLTRVQIRHSSGPKWYPVLDSSAALMWLGQVAALEVHVPQWRLPTPTGPTSAAVTSTSTAREVDRVVFDLDPGPGVGLAQCAEVAHVLRERLGVLGEQLVPVTSGSKGLHLYAPMDPPIPAAAATEWARQVAQALQQALPDLVVVNMSKAIRAGRVLVDWSQNNAKKTTIAPYSLRGRDTPTVAAPRTWAELAEPGLAHLHYRDVLERVADGLDPLAALLPAQARLRAALQTVRIPMVAAVPGGRAQPGPSAPSAPDAARARPAGSSRPSRPARPMAPPAVPAEPPVNAPSAVPAEPPVNAPSAQRQQSPPAAAAAGAGDRTGAGRWSPMLASAGGVGQIRAGDGLWRFEGKWDGMRALVQVTPDGLVAWSRTGRDVTVSFPELDELPALLRGHTAVVDGEIVAPDAAGRTDFSRLQQRMGLRRPGDVAAARKVFPVGYLIFDVLEVDGVDLTGKSYDDRRRILDALAIDGTRCTVPPQLTGTLDAVLAQTRDLDWEGVIAKRGDAPYLPGARSKTWVKVKHEQTLVATIVGWQPGEGRRTDTIGALLLAVPDDDGGWRYIGKVGTGFTDAALTDLAARLRPLRRTTTPITNPVPPADVRGAHWVQPVLQGAVVYSEITSSTRRLRHPRWRGLTSTKQVPSSAAQGPPKVANY